MWGLRVGEIFDLINRRRLRGLRIVGKGARVPKNQIMWKILSLQFSSPYAKQKKPIGALG